MDNLIDGGDYLLDDDEEDSDMRPGPEIELPLDLEGLSEEEKREYIKREIMKAVREADKHAPPGMQAKAFPVEIGERKTPMDFDTAIEEATERLMNWAEQRDPDRTGDDDQTFPPFVFLNQSAITPMMNGGTDYFRHVIPGEMKKRNATLFVTLLEAWLVEGGTEDDLDRAVGWAHRHNGMGGCPYAKESVVLIAYDASADFLKIITYHVHRTTSFELERVFYDDNHAGNKQLHVDVRDKLLSRMIEVARANWMKLQG